MAGKLDACSPWWLNIVVPASTRESKGDYKCKLRNFCVLGVNQGDNEDNSSFAEGVSCVFIVVVSNNFGSPWEAVP